MDKLKNNTLEGLLEWIYIHISSHYGSNESKAIARRLLGDMFNLGNTDFVSGRKMYFTESQIVGVYRAIKQLREHVPVQYITGKAPFRDLELKVNPSVLIPRPETEELVQWIIDDYSSLPLKQQGIKIWDIGTGSGAIAISLAQELHGVEVWSSDISNDALETAKQNGSEHQVNVKFFSHDILSGHFPAEKFDIVVSNPPYIRNSEKVLMHSNVLDYEPQLALFVSDDDPLIFYRAIGEAASQVLERGGVLYVEINEALGGETKELFQSQGFSAIEIKKDMSGKDRFVKATW